MIFKYFIIIQFFIIVLRGLPPILLFIIFNKILLEKEMANLLTIWSFGNILSAVLIMSSTTAASQYFFKSTTKITPHELKRAAYFQILRLLLFIIFAVLLVVTIKIFFNEYITYVPLVVYNMMIVILPVWKEYSTRNLSRVLLLESLFRIPILVTLGLCYEGMEVNNIFILMYFLTSIGIIYIVRDIYLYTHKKVFSFNQMMYTLKFIQSILQINIMTGFMTAGQVFLFSLFATDNQIIQAGMMERVKNIFLQLQGIFLSERLSKNRDYIRSKVFNFKIYIYNNIYIILIGLWLYIFSLVLYFLGIFDQIFLITSNIDIIAILILSAIPSSMLVVIFITTVYSSNNKITRYRVLYYQSFFVCLLIILLIYPFTNYIFLSMSLILDIIILILFVILNLKEGVCSHER